MFHLANILDCSAREYADKTAIVFGDKRITYAQLNAAANQVAGGLTAAGIGKGDKVALSCPNLPYFPMLYFGILKTGAVVVPLNVLFKSREIAHYLTDSEAKDYFCFQGTPELPMVQEGWAGFSEVHTCEISWAITAGPTAASPTEGASTMGQLIAGQSPVFDTVNTAFDDTAVIFYTSGTTGTPKGAELSHANLTFNSLGSRDLAQGIDEDIMLIALPLFHAFGQICQMATYKYPRIVEFRETLPMTATGKVLKKLLRAEADES